MNFVTCDVIGLSMSARAACVADRIAKHVPFVRLCAAIVGRTLVSYTPDGSMLQRWGTLFLLCLLTSSTHFILGLDPSYKSTPKMASEKYTQDGEAAIDHVLREAFVAIIFIPDHASG